jgi:hypothetical protein
VKPCQDRAARGEPTTTLICAHQIEGLLVLFVLALLLSCGLPAVIKVGEKVQLSWWAEGLLLAAWVGVGFALFLLLFWIPTWLGMVIGWFRERLRRRGDRGPDQQD